MAPDRNHVRRQRAIERGMPLLCQSRLSGCQVVESDQDLPAGAIRAARATVSGSDARLITMSQGADPPNLFGTAGHNCPGRQIAILRRMPLRSQMRICCLEIVEPGQHTLICAVWAAGATHPGGDGTRIFMAVIADPPGLPV